MGNTETNPTEFGPIEKAINWSNINAVEQNQALGDIMVTQQQIFADLAVIRKQLKKNKKQHKMSTQQFSQLHDSASRSVNMIVMTGAARMCWIYFMKLKYEVADIFVKFKAWVETQSRCKMQDAGDQV